MSNSQLTTWEVICKLEDYGEIISLKSMELCSWLIVPIKRDLRRVRQSWILCVSPERYLRVSWNRGGVVGLEGEVIAGLRSVT